MIAAADRLVMAFQRNVVVAASAGTGKTHRLTGLYVMLVLGLTSMGKRSLSDAHPPILPEKIVATTFSRAAALEIRARIERALRALAAEEASPFTEEIKARLAELDEPPSPGELVLRARRALDTFHEARIETLHGLCADLLRRHAFGLGLSPALRVLEEEEAEALAFGVIDERLAKALEGSDVERGAVRALADACGGFFRARDSLLPFFDRLDDDGIDLGELATSDYLGAAENLLQRIIAACRACAASARQAVQDAASTVLGALEEDRKAGVVRPSIGSRTATALEALFTLRKPAKANAAELELFSLRDGVDGATNAMRAKTCISTLHEARDLEDRERAVLALLGTIREALARERIERGVAGFSDLLRLARDGLRDHPPVARAAREEIEVLLVDEFQDTSLVQRDLVYLLREAAEGRRPGSIPTADHLEGHGLFIVGDRKQSIYGFRGADVAVYNRVCGDLCGPAARSELDLPAELCADVEVADLVALRDSYRSAPSIVGFVNAFSERDFAAASSPDSDVHVAYGPAESLVAIKPAGQEAVLFAQDDAAPIDEPLLVGAGAPLREAFVAASLAHRLMKVEGLAARDIAILARRRASIPLLELGLNRLGIPYVVAGRALFDTLEVRDLAALVRLVLEPRDRHALAHVLRGPLVALSDDALLALSTQRGLSPEILLESRATGLDRAVFGPEAERLDTFRRTFLDLRPTLLRLPAADAVRTAMASFDLDRVTAALPRAPSRLGNLDRLAQLARDRGSSLFAFSRWLDRQIADDADEAEAVVFSAEDDAVRLLTIHGSKGLDFPATIVVDLGAREQPGIRALRFVRMPNESAPRVVIDHRGARNTRIDNPARREANRAGSARANAERARITYVALTRARRVLALVGSVKRPSRGSMMHTFLEDREPSLRSFVETLDAAALVTDALASSATNAPPVAPAESTEAAPKPRRAAAEVSIATTPLGVFKGCARRFWFRFLLGLEEPVDTGQLDLFEINPEAQERKVTPFERDASDVDPRATGRAAHRALERLDLARFGAADFAPAELLPFFESDGLEPRAAAALADQVAPFVRSRYAARLASAREVHREAEVSLSLPGDPMLSLRGTVDLWSLHADHVDLVDYKLARPSPTLEPYAFQLRAYALALSKAAGGLPVRAGIVFLDGPPEPVWLPGADGGEMLQASEHAAFEAQLRSLTASFVQARATDEWPGIELAGCRRERCGFVTACHRNVDIKLPKRRKR